MAITKNITRWNAETQTYDKVDEVITFVGRVIKVYKQDYRAMSDVYTLATYATVINDEGKVEEYLVNANFECDVSGGRAVVDADEASKVIFAAHEEALRQAQSDRDKAYWAARAEEERNRPVKGKKMEVFKGRKVPIGTKGTVAFVSDDRVLLKDDDKWQDRKANGVWVACANLRAR